MLPEVLAIVVGVIIAVVIIVVRIIRKEKDQAFTVFNIIVLIIFGGILLYCGGGGLLPDPAEGLDNLAEKLLPSFFDFLRSIK